jgi:hypothetical protein
VHFDRCIARHVKDANLSDVRSNINGYPLCAVTGRSLQKHEDIWAKRLRKLLVDQMRSPDDKARQFILARCNNDAEMLDVAVQCLRGRAAIVGVNARNKSYVGDALGTYKTVRA